MPRLKASNCINCGERPAVLKSDDMEYPFMLRHVKEDCYHSFKLEVYHDTSLQCIKVWNEFNQPRNTKV